MPKDHVCYFFYHEAPGERLFTVDQLERCQVVLGEKIKDMFGTVDVCVFLMGANDIAQSPGKTDELAERYIRTMFRFYEENVCRKVACLAVGGRFGEAGFKGAHPDLVPVEGATTIDDSESLFKELATKWNDHLFQNFATHPDCYTFPLEGMKDLKSYTMPDGKHLNEQGLNRCFRCIKQHCIKIANKTCKMTMFPHEEVGPTASGSKYRPRPR
ncbi:MAG: hypothetical protein GY774_05095 [Planctomycetes bacterium]|nr:hypothetical protein [Planctomycetota bacterium]